MRTWGYTPSGRLFEAASCGTPVLTDRFPGLEKFFSPGVEILVADVAADVQAALELSTAELRQIGAAARERTLAQHTGANRARELVAACAGRRVLGIVPAAGAATRLQPLAFSKEMLPVGSALDEHGVERPKAVSEFLVERMIHAGADRICVILSPEKDDIIPYYARHRAARRFCYVVQEQPHGLCDALFRALHVMRDDEDVLIGLPDTVWFPVDGFCQLPPGELSFLLFEVNDPQRFDAVLTDADGRVREIRVKAEQPGTDWVWGAVRMPASTLRALHALWSQPERGDEYLGTLVNAYLAQGGHALGVPAGERYYDVGTVDGYHAAIDALRLGVFGRRRRESMSVVADDPATAWMAAMRRGDFGAAWTISDAVLASRPARRVMLAPAAPRAMGLGRPAAGRAARAGAVLPRPGRHTSVRPLPTSPGRALPRADRLGPADAGPACCAVCPLDAGRLPLHDGSPEVDYDVDIEIMELPHALRTTLEAAAAAGAVPVSSRPRRARCSTRCIGLVAQAGEWDARRSVPADLLGGLATLPGLRTFSLQPGKPLPGAEDISTPDVALLAARMLGLDLIVTVDTMAAHLAGALGVPTWTLLAAEADWRWMEGRDDSPWYPTMRLFRQPRPGDWESVVARVRAALAD